MLAACHLRGGGRLWASFDDCAFDSIENCFFKTSAYDWLDAECTGLSSRRGSWEAGGSIPSGIDFRIRGCKLVSIHARASSRLVLVVMIKHLRRSTSSIRKNHVLRRRWSYSEVGSVSEALVGSITANQARYSKLMGTVATVVRKKL